MNAKKWILFFSLVTMGQAHAVTTFNFEGVLTDTATGLPITTPTSVKFRIVNPGVTCTLFEESQTISPAADGSFSVKVGAGTRTAGDSFNLPLPDVFSNTTVFGSNGNCASGWTPTLADGRRLKVIVSGTIEMTPDFDLSPAPSAMYAQNSATLQGIGLAGLIKVNGGTDLNQTNLENIFSTVNYPKLNNLLTNGTLPNNGSNSVSFGNQVLTGVSSPISGTDAANKTYADTNLAGKLVDLVDVAPGTGNGKVLVWDSAANKWIASTANDGTKLPLTGGTMAGAINMGSYNITATGYISMGPQTSLQIGKYDSSQESSLIGSLTAGHEGTIWYNSSTDVLRLWNGTTPVDVGAGGAGISSLTGDVVASGPGSAVANISNNAVTTPKVFTNPGVNRLVATDATTGGTLTPFVCASNETIKYNVASGWVCTAMAAGGLVNGGNSLGSALSIGTNDPYPLTFRVGGMDKVGIDTAGRVGFGTTIPSAMIEATGADAAVYTSSNSTTYPAAPGSTVIAKNTQATTNTGAYVVLSSRNSSSNSTYSYMGSISQSGSSPALVFGTNDSASSYSEKMRIDPSGNVGIGTITPARKLHIYGSMRMNPVTLPGSPAAGDLVFDATDSNKLKYYDGTSWLTLGTGSGTGDFMANGSMPMSGQFRMFPGTAGGPGLTVSGDTDTGLFQPATDTVAFSTGGIEQVRIDASGNMGLGTVTPAYKLSVAGVIHSSTGGFRFPDGTTQTTASTGDFKADGTVAMTGDLNFTTNRKIKFAGAPVFGIVGSGDQSIGIGTTYFLANATGSGNVAIGNDAMRMLSGASDNVAIGNQAMRSAGASSNNNIVIGRMAGYSLSSGGHNAFIGGNAGYSMMSGIQNVMMGVNAGQYATGDSNTLLGANTGVTLTAGTYNILIGRNADVPSGSSSYYLNIGDVIRGDMNVKRVGVNGDPLTTFQVFSEEASVAPATITHFSSGAPTQMNFQRARGSKASPTYILAGDVLGGIGAIGYAGGTFGSPSGAIQFLAGENFNSASTKGTRIVFLTTQNASATPVQRMVVDEMGNVGINTSSPSSMAKLHVNGSIVGGFVDIPSGATADFKDGNVVRLQSVGGSVITVQNMVQGGRYTVIVSDVTARTYTFTGCSTAYFNPANGSTTASTRSKYEITYTGTECYIDWKSGY